VDETLSLPLRAQTFEGRVSFGNTELRAIPNKRLFAISYPETARPDMQARLGTLPAPGKSTELDDNSGILWTGVGEVFVLGNEDGPDAAAMADRIGTAGYITDLSDGWIALELEGDDARARLDLVTVPDLSDDAFAVGNITSTILSHIRVLIWRRTETSLVLLSAASTGRSLFQRLRHELALFDRLAEFDQ